jgi:hypothetical protein
MKQAWVEGTGNGHENPGYGASWDDYNGSGDAWTASGAFDPADCEQTDIGSVSVGDSESSGTKNISLTPTTKSGLDLGNGWLIKADTEVNDLHGYASSDNATAANRPKLTIEYTAPATASPAILRKMRRG